MCICKHRSLPFWIRGNPPSLPSILHIGERERESERKRESVCVREREREKEREKERE